jgi:hypothetical protein
LNAVCAAALIRALNGFCVMQLEELKSYLKHAKWFLHVGECQEREGVLCLPSLEDAFTDDRNWGWLPTDASAEDPIHGDSLRLLADSLGKHLERRESVREIYMFTLESMRKLGMSHPSFKVGPHNMLPLAKGAAAYAARMAATEIVVSRQGFWCSLIPLYGEGFYPCGYTEQGYVVVF